MRASSELARIIVSYCMSTRRSGGPCHAGSEDHLSKERSLSR